MKSQSILKVLNPLLGVLLVNQAITGLIGKALSRDVFDILHKGGGVALVIGIVIHLILNQHWIRANYFKRSERQAGSS